MRALLDSLVDLVLPRYCFGCGAGGPMLCARCRPGAVLRPEHAPVPTVAAGPYDAGLRRALLAYKERGRRDLAGPLADLVAGCLSELGPPADVLLVPVPSAAAAVRARGGDHVLRLARRTAARTGWPVAGGALSLAREVRDSAGLSSVERAINLAGAMVASTPNRRVPAVLVDDILTTGATLAEAARALRLAGWRVAGAVVVCSTQLRRGHPSGRVGQPARNGMFVR